ncbi:hypothetical protein ACSRUE_06690 [Sorangium sp. KYC3313]|uniref:hypothetical protein n=1 Tax=Sorangium sp. KYC3313 TaxID=3449740 RepID=UPI003F8C5A9E
MELPQERYYVQITNRGEAAALFDDLAIRLVESAPTSTPPDGGSPSNAMVVGVGLVAAGALAFAVLRSRFEKRAAAVSSRR